VHDADRPVPVEYPALVFSGFSRHPVPEFFSAVRKLALRHKRGDLAAQHLFGGVPEERCHPGVDVGRPEVLVHLPDPLVRRLHDPAELLLALREGLLVLPEFLEHPAQFLFCCSDLLVCSEKFQVLFLEIIRKLLFLRDIGKHGKGSPECAVAVKDRCRRDVHDADRPVPVEYPALVFSGFSRHPVPEFFSAVRKLALRHKRGDLAAQHLFGGVPEERCHPGVDVGRPEVLVHLPDPLVGCFHDPAELLFPFPDLLLGFQAFGKVGCNGDHRRPAGPAGEFHGHVEGDSPPALRPVGDGKGPLPVPHDLLHAGCDECRTLGSVYVLEPHPHELVAGVPVDLESFLVRIQEGAPGVVDGDRCRGDIEDLGEDAGVFLGPDPVRDVPDRLNRACRFPVLVVEPAGFPPVMVDGSVFPFKDGLGGEGRPLAAGEQVFLPLEVLPGGKHEVDEHRARFAVEGKPVPVVPHAEDFSGRNAGHLLHGPVPCDHLSLPVDGKRSVGQKIDDVGEAFPGLDHHHLGPPPGHSLADLVGEFHELGLRFPPLLEVEVRARVQRLDDDFLPPPAREDDEGNAVSLCPDGLEEVEPRHGRHLVVRDHGIEFLFGEEGKAFLCRTGHLDGKVSHAFEECLSQEEKVLVIVDVEDRIGLGMMHFWRKINTLDL